MDSDSFLERSKSAKEDACKWTLIIPKIILQSLSIWPEVQTRSAKILSSVLLINITFMLISHTAYFIENIRDIIKMAELLTSVNITLQSFVRITTMLYYKNEIQILLSKVWANFWPSNILQASENKRLKKLTVRYFSFVMIFGISATCTTVQFMYQPLVLGIRNLPLMLQLPFDYTGSPFFEILYVWNACTCMTIQFSVLGFDFFFTMLTWNCAVQFKILRLLLEKLVVDVETSPGYLIEQDDEESKQKKNEAAQKLIKYIEQHKKVIEICDSMESMFRYILLIQLLDSALALCVCCFAAVAVPSLFAKMMTFSVMYLIQLFLYCAFGNELLYQSTTLAYAAFRCGWHYSGNMEIRKTIIMLMQKSQQGQCLTARGFAVVNYSSCLQVLRMAFSFYTVLDGMKQKAKF